ncbi:DUF397 domain-containing protein [Streptomyces sp. NPDC047453]|uniref:DUF397 domain-containing protein n=1 Tax=Streptomyces sp. NPDC047453 TaxID=3154812 RepID=UPI0033E8D3DA
MAFSSELHWFKSSYSGGSGTECVECAHADDDTFIRDSKRTEGPMVRVHPETWRAFTCSLGPN